MYLRSARFISVDKFHNNTVLLKWNKKKYILENEKLKKMALNKMISLFIDSVDVKLIFISHLKLY